MYLVDHLLNAHAQLVVALALDGREGLADAGCCSAAHIVDEVGQVLRGLQLDLAVSAVHCVDVVNVVVGRRGRLEGRCEGLLFGGAPSCWSVHCNM